VSTGGERERTKAVVRRETYRVQREECRVQREERKMKLRKKRWT
jgi:hypothetical protein